MVRLFNSLPSGYFCPGNVAQSVTCLAVDMCQTADPGVESSIRAWSHTLVEIDREIISMVILLPSAVSRRVVRYKPKYQNVTIRMSLDPD